MLAPDELPVMHDDGTTATIEPAPPALSRQRLTPAMRGLRAMLALGLLVPVVVFLALWLADALRFLDVVR